MKTRNLLLALLITLQLPLLAQNPVADSIDNYIKKNLDEYGELSGMAISIVQGERSILTKAYGYADYEEQIPSTPNTSYYIASVTKSFLGVLAAKLEQEGTLDLSAAIIDLAPIKDFGDKSLFEGVTISDLLSHTSGIANVPLGWNYTNNGEASKEELIKILESETVSRNNRKAYVYDNFGYHVFDLILSEEFNLDWKTQLDQKIFAPIGMMRSTSRISKARNEQWETALPYTALNDNRTPALTQIRKNDATMHSAGGIMSSIDDMQKWLLINMNSGKLKGREIISSEVFNSAHEKRANARGSVTDLFKETGYGLGWMVGVLGDKKAVYHSGGFDGYYALCSFLPEEKIGITVVVNATHFGDNVANMIVSYAYDLLLGETKSPESYAQKEAKVEQRVNALQRAFAADRKRRAARKWKITRNIEQFSGEFYNEKFGKMTVQIVDGQPRITMGISNSPGSQSASEDAIRVEFRDGRGEDILFVFGKRQAQAAIYRGRVFYAQ